MNPNREQQDSGAAAKPVLTDQQAEGQVRMAAAMQRLHHGRLIYVPGVDWHFWDGRRWSIDDLERSTQYVLQVFRQGLESASRKLAKAEKLALSDAAESERLSKFAERLKSDVRKCQNATAIRGIKEIARSAPQFARTPEQLDSDPYLINLQNGTLNLKSGEFREHDPADLITKVCNASFDLEVFDAYDEATAIFYYPKWFTFLEQVLPDAHVREFVQVLMGLALVGTQLEHIMPIFFGNGRNGKGVFAEVMQHVLGDYAIPAARDLFTSAPGAHSTSQTDLMGTRLVFINETEEGAKLSEALVKDTTGGGIHTARRMRQDNIRFRRSWLPVMVTNHFPKVSGRGAAIWDRLLVIDFPVYFDANSRITGLEDDLKKEADGIFMWAYAGLERYRRDGNKLQIPQAVAASTQHQRTLSDKVEMWIADRCVRGSGKDYRVKSRELLAAYNAWAAEPAEGGDMYDTRARTMGIQDFLQAMRDKDFKYIHNRAMVEGLRVLGDAELAARAATGTTPD